MGSEGMGDRWPGAGSGEPEAGSREQRAGNNEPGPGSGEPEAGSREHASSEQGAGSTRLQGSNPLLHPASPEPGLRDGYPLVLVDECVNHCSHWQARIRAIPQGRFPGKRATLSPANPGSAAQLNLCA
jgi:hypothetical protein